MNDLWTIHDLPIELLWCVLDQPWCLAHSREGVLTILWSMPPDQMTWRLDRLVPPKGPMLLFRDEPIIIETFTFSVDHERHVLRWTGRPSGVNASAAPSTF